MPKLIKIGNVYGIRKRVPLDIVRTFAKTSRGTPKQEIWFPIGKDRQQAKREVARAELEAQGGGTWL